VNGSNSTPGQSEFHVHKAERLPGDSVAGKILLPLQEDDFKTGSLYAFTRDSSAGHVKIGWTSNTIQSRIDYWSDHGDEPKVLFSVHLVPHARRAETLTHHELINEWRRERRCQNHDCTVEHVEWFEVSKYRAKQVVVGWAEFIERAEPYDPDNGSLKPSWKMVVEAMEGKGELITAKKLLEHYEASPVGESTPIEVPLLIVASPSASEPGSGGASTPEISPVKVLPKTPDTAASSSSPKPNGKAEFNPRMEILRDLVNAYGDLKEVQERISSITQRLLEVEIRAGNEKLRRARQVESPAAKSEAENQAESDEDETLVFDGSPIPRKMVDGPSLGTSAGKGKAVAKVFGGPNVRELGAPVRSGIS
jgi:hypothetical protein